MSDCILYYFNKGSYIITVSCLVYGSYDTITTIPYIKYIMNDKEITVCDYFVENLPAIWQTIKKLNN